MERIDEPILNREIVKLFLEKLEQLSKEERAVLLGVLKLIAHPMFVTNNVN